MLHLEKWLPYGLFSHVILNPNEFQMNLFIFCEIRNKKFSLK